MKKLLYKITLPIQYLLVFLFIVFEEFIWEGIAVPVGEYLRSLRLLQALERAVRRMNRYLILVLFVLLFGGVELAGVTAGVLIVQGMLLPGFLLYGLKIPIAAFTFWLFGVSREQLLSFAWFAWAYEKILAFLAWLKSREIYRKSMAAVHRLKADLRRIWQKVKAFLPAGEGGLLHRLKALYRKVRNELRRNKIQ